MFRKTDTNEQLDIFSSPSTYMKGRTAKKYEDPHAWHNEFYQYVTSKIDEETFRPLLIPRSSEDKAFLLLPLHVDEYAPNPTI